MSRIKEKIWQVVWTPFGVFIYVVVYPVLEGASWVANRIKGRPSPRREATESNRREDNLVPGSESQSEAKEIEELRKIYKEAWNEGIFVREFSPIFAAAGSVKKVEYFEKLLEIEIDILKLTMAECMNLGAVPSNGKTRAETCRNAIKAYKEANNIK